MDLLQFVDQASEALKTALEKPTRNRRKGGSKKLPVTPTLGAASKTGPADGRIAKGRSIQRSFVCQQKVLEALFNPKVLHPTAEEQEQLEKEGSKTTVPPLRTRRLPASFFKGPTGSPAVTEYSSNPLVCMETGGQLQQYTPYPAEIPTSVCQSRQVPCSSPYDQPGAALPVPQQPYLQHQYHQLNHFQQHAKVETVGAYDSPETWPSERSLPYPDLSRHHDFYSSSMYPPDSQVGNLRGSYEPTWDSYQCGVNGYRGFPCAVESPTSVDSRGYASTFEDYSPSPVTSFTAEHGAVGCEGSIKIIKGTNHLDVCVDDFYGVAHSFPSTTYEDQQKCEAPQNIPSDKVSDDNVEDTFNNMTPRVSSIATQSNNSSPAAIGVSSPLPEFSYAFGNLCS